MLEVILKQIAIELLIAAARTFPRRTVAEAPLPTGPRSNRISRMPLPRPTIVSAIPGRVRFRVSALRSDTDFAHDLCVLMSRLPGVRFVEANATTGSFLAYYEAKEIDLATIARALAAWNSRRADAPFEMTVQSGRALSRSRYGHAFAGRTRRGLARAIARPA